MECNITKTDFNLCKTVLDGFFEEKVDLDIIIPDYCAAAVKILKCDVMPIITSASFDSDRMIIDGTCTANIIYVDEETGLIKSINESSNFTQNQPLRESLVNYRTKIKLRTSNVICRLQNSRRISIKAMVGIAVKVMGNSLHELISGFEDENIKSKYEDMECCVYINSGESDIRVSSEINTDAPVVDIIKCDSDLLVSDVKVINDKAIIKGNAKIECLYTTGESKSDIECDSALVPFSEIIDIAGATEDAMCDVECCVTGLRIDIGTSTDDNVINIELDGRANASVYNNTTVHILKDVYSKTNQLSLQKEQMLIESLVNSMNFTNTANEGMEVDIDNAVIKNISARPMVKNISAEGDMLVIEGDLNISAIAFNDDEYRIIDKVSPFKVTRDIGEQYAQMRCEANVNCVDINFSMPNNNSIDCKLELQFNIMVFAGFSCDVISDVMLAQDVPSGKLGSKVVLYYADEGENLWNIAKKYCTSVDVLKRDNDIESEDIKECCMLLISGE